MYKFIIYLLNSYLRIGSLFNNKIASLKEYHKNALQSIQKQLKGVKNNIIWMHCASLGEFEQGKPILETIKDNYPDYTFLVTFFSISGYLAKKDDQKLDYVFILPLDTKRNSKELLDLVKPKLIFFIKNDIWYHYISEAYERNIPIFSVATKLKMHLKTNRLYKRWIQKSYQKFTYIFTQDVSSYLFLRSLNIHQATFAGDTRFDNVKKKVRKTKLISLLEKFVKFTPTLVIGSCWPKDLHILIPYINKTLKKWKFIIAPHEISEKGLRWLKKKIHKTTTRFSRANLASIHLYDVCIIDSIGLLFDAYQYATFAYIGGGFKEGLHNILEPAAFGKPIFFGNKKYKSYPEAVDLIQNKGAFAIKNTQQFSLKIDALYEDCLQYTEAVGNITKYMKSYPEVTHQIMKHPAITNALLKLSD